MKTEQKAPAKINLTLDIASVLPDGYHSIFTVMQTVDLCDTVTVETADGGVTLTCTEGAIPCDERNTAYKAAALFRKAANITEGVQVHIEKRIPSQAGLAGGSADAAAVLRALDELFPERLTEKQLYEIAFSIGADVPFCLAGGARLCLNKGEIMARLPSLDAWVVLVKPEENVSTGEAYARFDSAQELFHPDNDRFLFHAAKGEYKKALAYAANTFEDLCDLPCGAGIKSALYAGGAYYAAMSGSGSAFFGLFDDEARAAQTAKALRRTYERTWLCRTVTK
ncbi:MAG: 4-(cytidine 5'-diphospho)-2-C-methyl-D-erythritol kinase [Clostridia bacterium]|nr:4-(cytidine 5'-diphospho)-2-C-methyl-D-erythritol kinase [Clostridia bacterium]